MTGQMDPDRAGPNRNKKPQVPKPKKQTPAAACNKNWKTRDHHSHHSRRETARPPPPHRCLAAPPRELLTLTLARAPSFLTQSQTLSTSPAPLEIVLVGPHPLFTDLRFYFLFTLLKLKQFEALNILFHISLGNYVFWLCYFIWDLCWCENSMFCLFSYPC